MTQAATPDSTAQPRSTYSSVSIALHWTLAILAVTQILLIWAHEAAPEGERTFIGLHVSVGATILVLTVVRLLWRLKEPWIPLPPTTPAWQKVAARANHVLFYAVLLGMPLAGWAAFSAFDSPVSWFGLFELPRLPTPADRELGGQIIDAHKLAAKLLYVLIALHVLGALKHHLVDKDNVVRRMLPFLPPRP